MKSYISICVLLLYVACTPSDQSGQVPMPPYPETPVKTVTNEYWGVQIEDHYQYLEKMDDPEVAKWYKDHSERARFVLDAITGRDELIALMKEFDKRRTVRVYNLNISETNRYFYLKQTPEDETGKLFYRDGFEGEETLLFDPENYENSADEMYVISSHYPSPDGTKIAFEIAPNGSESSQLMIMDVAKKELYPEVIDRCWFASCSWLPDGQSFYYNRLQSANVHDMDREKDSKTYKHTLGSDPAEDVEFFSREMYPQLGIKPEEFPIIFLEKDAGYIFGGAFSVDRRFKVWYAAFEELGNKAINWTPLFTREDEVYDIEISKTHIYAFTPKDAPKFKILRMPLSDPDLSKAEVIVPEFEDRSINDFALTNEALYLTTTKNGVQADFYRVALNDNPSIEQIELPDPAGRLGLTTRGYKFPDVWVAITGWTQNGKNYRYNSAIDEFKHEQMSTIAEFPEYDNLVVEEVLAESHDGAMVPLSLIYNKELKKDGTNPVMMMGYGAYGISINPFFSPDFLLWTMKGGIIAIAHVRGGGEKGDAWREAGHKNTKPNTWKDLIACAEYLIGNEYSSPRKIAISGGSAGGILIGRAMTARPDLFGVALPDVGCMNAVRMEDSPNGPVNVPEFGTMKDSVEAMALIEMDAYHHVENGVRYPATLVTAGMNDPRVIAWQPGKYAARLTAANASDKPILFYTDYKAGHGIGDSKTKRFESLADSFSFSLWQLGHPEFKISELPIEVESPEEDLKETAAE